MADAATFIDALRRLEDAGDVEPLAALHAADASVSNPQVTLPQRGPDGAREFWRKYRAAFGEIRSDFHHVLEQDGAALLEWTSTGTVKDQPVKYRGVSVLEFGDGGITAFRTYFDTRHLGEQIGPAEA